MVVRGGKIFFEVVRAVKSLRTSGIGRSGIVNEQGLQCRIDRVRVYSGQISE